MLQGHTSEDLLDFLAHAGERGLMPSATARALAVAARNVLSVLDDDERANLPVNDLEGVIRRFNNKRARDFNPSSLKEYGRRFKHAVDMYLRWREDPANFAVKTRATRPAAKKDRAGKTARAASDVERALPEGPALATAAGQDGYQTAFAIRPGHVVTVTNIPYDLTIPEAERLGNFIRVLAQEEI